MISAPISAPGEVPLVKQAPMVNAAMSLPTAMNHREKHVSEGLGNGTNPRGTTTTSQDGLWRGIFWYRCCLHNCKNVVNIGMFVQI